MTGPLLSVEALDVRIHTERGTVHAVNGLSFSVEAGETLAIVGESGCGKSVTGLAIARLLPQPAAEVAGGRILFDGRDLSTLGERQMQQMRGRDISMIFQDPMTSLNPVLTIGEQLAETATRADAPLDAAGLKARLLELVAMVGIPGGERILRSYPHQLSGGMRQRVMIAMALALAPRLLIADEPTTGLDVTVEAQILDLMGALIERAGTAVVLVTHDLGVVAGATRKVVVMYSGMMVETAATGDLFASPGHPYTIGLIHASPRLDGDPDADLIAIEGVPPNQLHRLDGCPFAPRCAWRLATCWTEIPRPATAPAAAPATGSTPHLVACHNPATADEARAGRPLRPGFGALPPAGSHPDGEVLRFERSSAA